VGTSTDASGNYSIQVSPDAVLIFSFMGYESQEIPVGSRSEINIVMAEDIGQLEEVVVVGYGVVDKKDLTGSVNSLRARDFNPGVQMSVDQMIQGRAPGVQVTQASSEPGGGISIRIRGASSITAGNEPLYVIDGLPITNFPAPGSAVDANPNPRNPLNALNPEDVESIEVLKDASATAIYGSRGANGVILITTKKGSRGKMKVEYNTYVGM
jgi:TonB-dependent starch-binding outer membrane protein SusC